MLKSSGPFFKTRVLLQLLIAVALFSASAELSTDTDRVQTFNFKTATHYRKEYKGESVSPQRAEVCTVVGKSKWYHQLFQGSFHLKR